jgi:hypothetical protein
VVGSAVFLLSGWSFSDTLVQIWTPRIPTAHSQNQSFDFLASVHINLLPNSRIFEVPFVLPTSVERKSRCWRVHDLGHLFGKSHQIRFNSICWSSVECRLSHDSTCIYLVLTRAPPNPCCADDSWRWCPDLFLSTRSLADTSARIQIYFEFADWSMSECDPIFFADAFKFFPH